MIVDQSHRPWALATLAATIAVSLIYVYEFYPAWLPFLPQPTIAPLKITPGRTDLGIIYGSIALAIFFFAALYGWRRKRPALRVGRVQTWLRAHIWFSIFTIPLVLLHAGFVTGGLMTTLLMIIYAIVMVSGFFGLALQQILPRIMANNLPMEAIYEQIPHIRAQLLTKALAIREAATKIPAALVAAEAGATGSSEKTPTAPVIPVFPPESVHLINESVISYLEATNGRKLPLASTQVSDVFFGRLRLLIPVELKTQVNDLQILCNERRLLDLQTIYQHWLHGWLVVHVPLSLVLLVLSVWHAVIALFFT